MKTFLALSAFVALNAFSQETRSATRLTNDHYFDFERVSNAQISPDGAHIVYTRQQANKIEDRWDSSLWIMNADGSQNRFLTKGSSPRWSSDGKRILYIADGEPRGPADLRPLDRYRRTRDADHARDREGRRRALVARRKAGSRSPCSCPRKIPGTSACRPRPKARNGPARRAS